MNESNGYFEGKKVPNVYQAFFYYQLMVQNEVFFWGVPSRVKEFRVTGKIFFLEWVIFFFPKKNES